MSRKPPRDPGAPKRNQSAYILYQNQMRDTFKLQNPGMTFGQLSKFTSAMYAELSPEEKEEWVVKAEDDKQRYLQELARYHPPPGFDDKGDPIPGTFPHYSPDKWHVYQKLNTKGVQKDPNAPKRCKSAYLLYQNAMRDTFKAQYPAMSFGELSKHTSEQYKKLSAEEKKGWQDKAEADKERYESELANYAPPEGYDTTGVMIASKEPGRRKYTQRERDVNAPKVRYFFSCLEETLWMYL
jgi:hypothetical protein